MQTMDLPSGKVLSAEDIHLLTLMARNGFIRYESDGFKFHSGIKSQVYVSAREELTDNPDLMWAIGSRIGDLVRKNSEIVEGRWPCLIGVPTAGTPLAVAASTVSANPRGLKDLLSCRYMREARKEHGAHQRWVNGDPDLRHHEYWLVDNAISTGDSVVNASERLAEDGYPSRPSVLVLIDRQFGGVERLKQLGFRKVVIGYNILDVAYVFAELGHWSKSVRRILEDEIEASKILLQPRS